MGMEQIDIVADMVVSKVRVHVHLNVNHRLQSLEYPYLGKNQKLIAQLENLISELEQGRSLLTICCCELVEMTASLYLGQI